MSTTPSYNSDHVLTPTWQSIWMNLINQSLNLYIEENYYGSWQTLTAFYGWLPQDCAEELKTEYETVKHELEKLSHSNGISLWRQNLEITNNVNNYLRRKIPDLSEKTKRSLEAHNYLEFKKSRPPTRETSGHDIEMTVGRALYGKKE